MIARVCPTASAAVWPSSRSAAGFQAVITPFVSTATSASAVADTIAWARSKASALLACQQSSKKRSMEYVSWEYDLSWCRCEA